jgi:hypothetical protein
VRTERSNFGTSDSSLMRSSTFSKKELSKVSFVQLMIFAVLS